MDNQVLEVIKKRSSARAYSDEEVTKEQLEKVIEAGLQGPTGMNKKEIHFTAVFKYCLMIPFKSLPLSSTSREIRRRIRSSASAST